MLPFCRLNISYVYYFPTHTQLIIRKEMINYLLTAIAIFLMLLVGYTQFNKEKTTEEKNPTLVNRSIDITKSKRKKQNLQNQAALKDPKKTISSNTINNVPDADELSLFNKEMAENEKEIIKKFLEEKETLSRTYNLDEEDNVPTEPASLQNEEVYEDISMEELDKIEKENNLQPQVVDMPNIQEDTQENTPMTQDELENAEINAGMQETLKDNSEPLDPEDIPFQGASKI